MNEKIINSLLDNDFYKFTMMNAVFHQCPGTDVVYKFKCRNDVKWVWVHAEYVKAQIKHLCSLRFTQEELDYLSDFPFFHKDFIDFLELFQFNESHINVWVENEELNIEIKGSWLLTILYEVPILAIVNEIRFEQRYKKFDGTFNEATKRLFDKIDIANNVGFDFADFGTRRRFSHEWQDWVIQHLYMRANHFVGTSNVYFAMKYGIKCIGTQAHEWYMGFQGMNVKLKESQKKALQVWVDEYRGDLGIALSDTVGFDNFLVDFDKYFAKLYDGVRHDSGDPLDWAYKMIDHYHEMGIDPGSKTLVFSDGLDFKKAAKLYTTLHEFINVSFGIGTNLTNDFATHEPLQIVIKMTECNGNPVAKISDSPGKTMCEDEDFLNYIKSVFK